MVQLASTGLADITGPVSTLFLGLSIPILVLFLRLKSKRTSWCGCQVGGIEPWLRVAVSFLSPRESDGNVAELTHSLEYRPLLWCSWRSPRWRSRPLSRELGHGARAELSS